MRVITFTILSGFLLAGLTIAPKGNAPLSATLNFAKPDHHHIADNNNRTRDTSYRGSGRRAILAFPISHIPGEA